MNWQKKKVLITGGGGFLGRYIIESLLSLNCTSITSLGRSPQPELANLGVKVICGNIADEKMVLQAAEEVDLIFHTAAKAGIWGPYKQFYNTNVIGTENILTACRSHKIPLLINTSSPSVVSAAENIEHGDESIAYPAEYLAYYPQTKAEAEKKVAAAANSELRTISLRPHLIWGPRDPHILPRLLGKAKSGRLRQVGDGKNKVDLTFVENAAAAHLQAAASLAEKPEISGKNYFISDDEPVMLWQWINDLLTKLGIPEINKQISFGSARKTAAVLETVFKILHLPGEPPMTRFIAAQLAHSHYFNISAAKKAFGYHPVISGEKAMEKTVTFFTNKLN